MPVRLASPAASENEIDISTSLFRHDSSDASDSGFNAAQKPSAIRSSDVQSILRPDDSDTDDAGIIAQSTAAANRKAANVKGKSVKKGGGFQAMGLSSATLKAITRKGYTVPTPVQRKTIPLIMSGQDVVGMARTGSGKTAAFVLPMLEKLRSHSAKVGARGLILSPSRELALQTLKVVKELGRGTDLKCILVVGGETLEEQFASMSSNPDIIIATPGRFLHLKVEMSLDLSTMSYVVFDEADRLFEMGFAAQLTEILNSLPPTRQTLLFSATLPKSLVELARAGLQEPQLVRLDQGKVSPDLQSAFYSVKSAEKEGALLHLLNDVAAIPTRAVQISAEARKGAPASKRKRKHGEDDEPISVDGRPSEHATIVFVATKHHVEYIATLLRQAGFAVSHAYGSLDQTARKMQVHDFRTGQTDILVVTDVAARGIDIPILANVINYDFPAQPKLWVHRIGRTARAGQRGWSYSLVRVADAPYMLDLQLFLGRRLVVGRDEGLSPSYTDDIVVGSPQGNRVEANCEWVVKLLEEDADLHAMRSVATKGEKLYLRTRHSASTESVRRAKILTMSRSWAQLHPLFGATDNDVESERASMLARVSGFRPSETVFELGKRGQKDEAADVIRRQRHKLEHKDQTQNTEEGEALPEMVKLQADSKLVSLDDSPPEAPLDIDMDSASDNDLEVTFSNNDSSTKRPDNPDDFKSSDYFMNYKPTGANEAEDRAYGVNPGVKGGAVDNSLFRAANEATMDLATDEAGRISEPSRQKRWDKKAKKYIVPADKIANSSAGSGETGKRYIRSESGQKIAASFRSGRFDAWKKANKVARMPRAGESESALPKHVSNHPGGKRFKYNSLKAPKEADKYRDDYHKKKKKLDQAKAERRGMFSQGKSELKGIDAIRKTRREKEQRRQKTGPGKKRGKRR